MALEEIFILIPMIFGEGRRLVGIESREKV
jgi:hypothetical protein